MKANYKEIAKRARLKVLEMIYKAQTSHIGSNFSVIDIATVLYENANLAKDRIVWSKGWAAATAYYFLAEKRIIPKKDLDTFCQGNSKYIGLVEPTVKGIDFAGGSMGMGLPAGIGYALAKKLKKEAGTVFVIMSDGEQDIGTTWESALIGSHHRLDNLAVIIDYNKFQAMGKTNEILTIEPLKDKWESFGWDTYIINGHDFEEIEKAIKIEKNKPMAIIANTIKGKGWKRIENNNIYHYKYISGEEYQEAKEELYERGYPATR